MSDYTTTYIDLEVLTDVYDSREEIQVYDEENKASNIYETICWRLLTRLVVDVIIIKRKTRKDLKKY